MRTIFTFLLAAFALIATSCSKQKNATGDYIIVGRTGGIFPMADYYQIKDGQLKHDTLHKTMLQSMPDNLGTLRFDVVMPDDRYQKVAHLQGSIPAELLKHNNERFGKSYPDAQTLEIHASINGTVYHWYFLDANNLSTDVQKFATDADKAFY